MENKVFPKGLDETVIKEISKLKREPKWVLDFRLESFKNFQKLENPCWGPDLSDLDLGDIRYYSYGGEKRKNWEEIPEDIKKTFAKLGISPEEQRLLAGLSTQYESEIIYSRLKEKWQSLGIIFENTDEAIKKHPKLFRKYFGKLVQNDDNKYAALNSAVWSGGSFIYVPKGVKLTMPIQTYFRINTQNMGQFERTLIIADEDSEIHYIEGCTAPQYMTNSLHAAVVEIFAKPRAKVKYTTIQNWSKNIYNLVTKRSMVEDEAIMEWLDCNIGSKVTMKYPTTILKGEHSQGNLLSMALCDEDQSIDSGGNMIHIGAKTKSSINSRTVSKNGGVGIYRGKIKIDKMAQNSRSFLKCDGVVMDKKSNSYSYPVDEVNNTTSMIEHEAKISKLSEQQIKYLMSRGLTEKEATQTLIHGFINPVVKDLPMEYAVELEKILDIFLE